MARQVQPLPVKRELVAPLGGVSDDMAFSNQIKGTTRRAKNVRNRCPVTGSIRLAQRAGLQKAVSLSAGTGPVQALGRIGLANRAVEFTEPADADIVTEWKTRVPSAGVCWNVKVDRSRNVVACDGNSSIVLYSASGEQIQTISLPTATPAHLVRSLWVDSSNFIFAAVTESVSTTGIGGLAPDGAREGEEGARLWCFEPDAETGEYGLLWEIETNTYVGDLVESDNLLYTVQNVPEDENAFVIVYEGIRTLTPSIERVIESVYPLHGIRVQQDGSIIVASPPQTNRGQNPKHPSYSPINVGWQPRYDLDTNSMKLRAELRADRVLPQDLDELASGGFALTRWRSILDDGIDLFVESGKEAPGWTPDGLGGTASVTFNGVDQALTSLTNIGVTKSFASQQKSLLPMHEGAQFVLMMVVHLEPDSGPGCIISQEIEDTLSQTDAQAYELGIIANRKAHATDTTIPANSEGFVSVFDPTPSTAGADQGQGDDPTPGTASGPGFPHPNSAIYNVNNQTDAIAQDPNAGILTYFHDGRVRDAGGVNRSVWRWNGTPLDRFRSRPLESTKGTKIGYSPNVGAWGHLRGEIKHILVFEREDLDDDDQAIIDHPDYGPDTGGPDGLFDPLSDTTMEKAEAYLAWLHQLQHLLDEGDTATTDYDVNPGAGSGRDFSTFSHAYSNSAAASNTGLVPLPSGVSAGDQQDPNKLLEDEALVIKYSATDDENPITWIYHEDLSAEAIGDSYVGLGLDLFPQADDGSTQDIATVGIEGARRLVDKGLEYSIAGADGAWRWTLPAGPQGFMQNRYIRIVVDEHGSLYFPTWGPDGNASRTLNVINSAGTLLVDFQSDIAFGQDQPGLAVDVWSSPDYDDDIAEADLRAQHVVIGTLPTRHTGGDTGLEVVHRVRLFDLEAKDPVPSPREVFNIVVCDGNVRRWDTTPTMQTVSGGGGIIDSGARYVSVTQAFGKLYLADGVGLYCYDPKTDQVEALKATAGEVPRRPWYLELWNGRLVVLDEDEPFGYRLSEADNPGGWDLSPVVITQTDATDGTAAEGAGRMPELVQTFIPFNDRLAFLGTDNSIYRLLGDPAAGGRFTQVTKKFGTGFGRCWTFGPHGDRVYLWISQGDVGVMNGDGRITRLGSRKIKKRLEAIDQSTHRIELSWDWKRESLVVSVIAFGTSTIVETYAWHEPTGAWWPDEIGDATKQVTAVLEQDQDGLGLSTILFGHADGEIRMPDDTGDSDDGTPIASECLFWPVQPKGVQRESGFTELQAELAHDQDGVSFRMLAAPRADIDFDTHPAAAQGRFQPGENAPFWSRARGSYVGVLLHNGGSGRWALEELAVAMTLIGGAKGRR